MKRFAKTFCVAALLSLPFATNASAEILSGEEIRNSIIGKRIYLSIPLGGEFPLRYQNNGVVKGDGSAVGVGRFFSPKDQGRWWIKGNDLCQQWQEWYEGRTFCFKITDLRGDKFRWQRDDGRKGKARIE